MNGEGHVVTIFGAKGGIGKTTLAANLAVALRDDFNTKVALIEFTAGASEMARVLDSTGVHLVSGRFADVPLAEAIAELRKSFDLVLIDAGSTFTELAVAAFDQSNLILLITTPDLVTIQRTNEALRQFEQMNVPSRMLRLVLNRAESHGNFRSSQVKGSLPLETIAEIPSDGRIVGLAINQGAPFVRLDGKSRIAQSMKAWAKFLLTHPELFIEHIALDRTKVPEPVSREVAVQNGHQDTMATIVNPMIALKQRLHGRLVEQLDLKRFDLRAMNDPTKARELRERVEQVVLNVLVGEKGFVADPTERRRLVKELVDDFIGLGPLEDLIADSEISDILVNGPDLIYVEKRGRLVLTDKRFLSTDQVLTVIERIIAPLGRRIDESNPMVDARLPDGSRINAVISPLAIKGPTLSIRKFGRERYTIDDLLRMGSLTPAMAEFLKICVLNRKNIIVSGGTGSGKTTLLNVLSAFIPDDERIVTIEDAAELRLVQRHWVALEARMANIEGRGEVTIRNLFRNTLRMRPDRIIIGECRGDETLDMLQAMNTGHDGSLTTLHANSPQDVFSRLDSLVLMSHVDLPVRAVREQIVSAIDLIVHISRFTDGSRKVTHITQVTGMDEREGITFGDIFLFQQRGVDAQRNVVGEFKPTGYLPSFLPELRAKGVPIDEAMFKPRPVD